MHLKAPNDIKVVKVQEKEAHLRAFIISDLEQRKALQSSAHHEYQVIARSIESPVIRVLAAMSNDLAKARVAVSLVITNIDMHASQEATHGHAAHFVTTSTRLADDPRLFDAHEQLVISEARVWIGDVLRREPSKRDAFENFSENCTDTARWAKTAFKRIFAASKPLPAMRIDSPATFNDDPDFAHLPGGVEASKDNDAPAGTRH